MKSIAATVLAISAVLAQPASADFDYRLTFKRFALAKQADVVTLGKPTAYAPHARIVQVPVVLDEYAVLDQTIEFQFDTFDWPIPAGLTLSSVASVSGGASAAIPKSARIFCTRTIARPDTGGSSLPPERRDAIRARYDRLLTLCFIDSDADGKLDKSLMVGLKNPADRVPQPIPPAPYRLLNNQPLVANSYLRIVYQPGSLFAPSLELQLFINGQQVQFEHIRFGGEGTVSPAQSWVPFKSKGFPQTLRIADAAFTVHALDPAANTSTVSIDKEFGAVPFDIDGVLSMMSITLPPYQPPPKPTEGDSKP